MNTTFENSVPVRLMQSLTCKTGLFFGLILITNLFDYGTVAQEVGQQVVDDRPVKEIGLVNWGRDYDAAQSISKKSGRPILLLFQEIPGCQGCQDYGDQVLSHPLIVEAAEDLFVPTLVYNNREGVDAELLKRFDEPSWNYPVARYLDSNGADLIPRKDKIWDVEPTARRMINALEKTDRDVPEYLRLLATDVAKLEKATFAMHCYWEGEAALGSLNGVVGTRSAWLDDKEVVEVEFDPREIGYSKLVAEARKMKCASNVYAHSSEQLETAQAEVGDLAELAADFSNGRVAQESDQKYYLRNSSIRFLPLTVAQAVKINSALCRNEKFEKWLSPRQQTSYEQFLALPVEQQKELSAMMFPDNDSQLVDYQKQLDAKLQSFSK